MMTIDTMIYIILAITGITTVSLYLNIYCAIRLYNILDQSDKLDSAKDAIEDLHIENMHLTDKINQLRQALASVNNEAYDWYNQVDQPNYEKL